MIFRNRQPLFLRGNAPGQFYVFCQDSRLHILGKQTLNPPRLAQATHDFDHAGR
jgi:hypothetical protein